MIGPFGLVRRWAEAPEWRSGPGARSVAVNAGLSAVAWHLSCEFRGRRTDCHAPRPRQQAVESRALLRDGGRSQWTSTPPGLRGCVVNEVLARLEKIYRQQLEIYDQVLELAEQAVSAAREGRPLQELDALLAQKRRLLTEIDRLDALAAPDRLWWKQDGRSASETSRLHRPLAEAARRIQQILAREREMERWILTPTEDGDEMKASTEAGD